MRCISVIIPCYNQGQYLLETLDSLYQQTYQDFDIIIVDDGSTDEETKQILKELDNPKIKIIRSSNQGLSNARNLGIQNSQSKYILPLDADDKIEKTYLCDAYQYFNKNPNTTLIYCLARKFGEVNEFWELPKYNRITQKYYNQIFCTAMYKREDWLKTSGYNPNMKFGYEDWDFWLSLLKNDGIVYQIPKILFNYRIKKKSMVNSINWKKEFYLRKQLYFNHKNLYNSTWKKIKFWLISLEYIVLKILIELKSLLKKKEFNNYD